MSNITHNTNDHGSKKAYIIGFILSLVLTFAAYIPTSMSGSAPLFPTQYLVTFVIVLALIQLMVQLLFFLHLAQEKGPRLNLIFFISTIGIVFLVVVGSIWIMTHLNANMMPEQFEEFIIEDEALPAMTDDSSNHHH